MKKTIFTMGLFLIFVLIMPLEVPAYIIHYYKYDINICIPIIDIILSLIYFKIIFLPLVDKLFKYIERKDWLNEK